MRVNAWMEKKKTPQDTGGWRRDGDSVRSPQVEKDVVDIAT